MSIQSLLSMCSSIIVFKAIIGAECYNLISLQTQEPNVCKKSPKQSKIGLLYFV